MLVKKIKILLLLSEVNGNKMTLQLSLADLREDFEEVLPEFKHYIKESGLTPLQVYRKIRFGEQILGETQRERRRNYHIHKRVAMKMCRSRSDLMMYKKCYDYLREVLRLDERQRGDVAW